MSAEHKPPAAHGSNTCANCEAPLSGAFCHRCGQTAHIHRSLLHILEETLHGILHFDTKTWRTLPLLIARPGLLTRRYIDGQRVRYVPPLSLFLFTVFLMFFAMSFIGSPNTVVSLNPNDAAPPPAVNEADRTTRSEDGAATRDNSGAVDTGSEALDRAIRNAIDDPELTLYKLKNTAYKFSFMLIPISLPFLWLMFLRRPDVRLYDHAVFSLYSLSFMSLVLIGLTLLALSPATSRFGAYAWGLPPIHMFLQLRETYRLGFFATAWRTVVLVCVAGTVFLVFVLMILAIAAT
jgi:hypothetical protein